MRHEHGGESKMAITLAFDVYGTLIDTAGVTEGLRGMVGDRAPLFSRRWREKQLEYAFRRGLMGAYRDFSVCTRDALVYTCQEVSCPLSETQRASLLQAYRQLPQFPDARPALGRLQAAGYRLYAFSNGRGEDVDALLTQAAIRDCFIDIVSVDEVRCFKPDPRVYRHFLHRTGATSHRSWLISGNPFDILGAAAIGMNTVWVRRQIDAVFDPWESQPSLIIRSLTELPQVLER